MACIDMTSKRRFSPLSWSVLDLFSGASALGVGLAYLGEQMFVIVWLGSEQEVHLKALQLADVRSVAR